MIYFSFISRNGFFGILTVNPGEQKIRAKADFMPADSVMNFKSSFGISSGCIKSIQGFCHIDLLYLLTTTFIALKRKNWKSLLPIPYHSDTIKNSPYQYYMDLFLLICLILLSHGALRYIRLLVILQWLDGLGMQC